MAVVGMLGIRFIILKVGNRAEIALGRIAGHEPQLWQPISDYIAEYSGVVARHAAVVREAPLQDD